MLVIGDTSKRQHSVKKVSIRTWESALILEVRILNSIVVLKKIKLSYVHEELDENLIIISDCGKSIVGPPLASDMVDDTYLVQYVIGF